MTMPTPPNSPEFVEVNPTYVPSLKHAQAITTAVDKRFGDIERLSLDGGVQLPLDQATPLRRLSFDN